CYCICSSFSMKAYGTKQSNTAHITYLRMLFFNPFETFHHYLSHFVFIIHYIFFFYNFSFFHCDGCCSWMSAVRISVPKVPFCFFIQVLVLLFGDNHATKRCITACDSLCHRNNIWHNTELFHTNLRTCTAKSTNDFI